jgi:hypothetical protein
MNPGDGILTVNAPQRARLIRALSPYVDSNRAVFKGSLKGCKSILAGNFLE